MIFPGRFEKRSLISGTAQGELTRTGRPENTEMVSMHLLAALSHAKPGQGFMGRPSLTIQARFGSRLPTRGGDRRSLSCAH